MNRNQHSRFFLLLLLLTALLLPGCNTAEMQSKWTTPLTLGENDSVWSSAGQLIDDTSKTQLSVMNDENFLYVRLMSRKQSSQTAILKGGLTVWLGTSDDEAKQLGVQFPIGRHRQITGEHQGYRSGNNMENMLGNSRQTMAILSDVDETRQTMPTSTGAEMGFHTFLTIKDGYLIYELKTVLDFAKQGKTVTLLFETGKIEPPARRENSGGGRGKGRGGGQKKMGGRGGGHGKSMPQPISIEVNVHLAEKNPPASIK